MNEMIIFEVGIKYQSVSENGLTKAKTDKFLTRRYSFSEAENAAYEYIPEDSEVVSIRATKAEDLVQDELPQNNIVYLVRYSQILLDEKTGKEKKVRHSVYLLSSSLEEANKAFNSYMKGSIVDYNIDSITETKIYGII